MSLKAEEFWMGGYYKGFAYFSALIKPMNFGFELRIFVKEQHAPFSTKLVFRNFRA